MSPRQKQHLEGVGWLTFCLCGGLILDAIVLYGGLALYLWARGSGQ